MEKGEALEESFFNFRKVILNHACWNENERKRNRTIFWKM